MNFYIKPIVTHTYGKYSTVSCNSTPIKSTPPTMESSQTSVKYVIIFTTAMRVTSRYVRRTVVYDAAPFVGRL